MRSSCAKPSTELSGVRSSWLMRERNSLLARSVGLGLLERGLDPQPLGDVLVGGRDPALAGRAFDRVRGDLDPALDVAAAEPDGGERRAHRCAGR